MRSAGSTISIPTKLLATGVACAVTLLVCGTAATVVVASEASGRLSDPKRERIVSAALGVAPAGPGFRDTGATAAALDSLVAPTSTFRSVQPIVMAQLMAFNLKQDHEAQWVAPPAGIPTVTVPTTIRRRIGLNLAGLDSLTAEELALAASDTLNAWLPLFRDWARGTPQASLWGYRSGLPGVRDIRDLPIRSYAPWKVVFAANEFAALIALRDGKANVAMARARENIGASRHFLEQPQTMDALIGRAFLRRGLRMLALAATTAGDTATALAAQQLDSAAGNFPTLVTLRKLARDEASGHSHAAEDFAADTAQHPALRVAALSVIALGGCRNLPEIVFGFSADRREAMIRAAASLTDIDRGPELGEKYLQFMNDVMTLREPPDHAPTNSVLDSSVLLNTFAWIIPPGVRARAFLCFRQGL